MSGRYSPSMPPAGTRGTPYVHQEMTDASPSRISMHARISPFAQAPNLGTAADASSLAQQAPHPWNPEHESRPASGLSKSHPQVTIDFWHENDSAHMRSPLQPHHLPYSTLNGYSTHSPMPSPWAASHMATAQSSYTSGPTHPQKQHASSMSHMQNDGQMSALDPQAGAQRHAAGHSSCHESVLETTATLRKQVWNHDQASKLVLPQQTPPTGTRTQEPSLPTSSTLSAAQPQYQRTTFLFSDMQAPLRSESMLVQSKPAQPSRHDSLDPASPSPPGSARPRHTETLQSPVHQPPKAKMQPIKPFTGEGHRPISLAATHPSQYRTPAAQMAPPPSTGKPVRLIPVTQQPAPTPRQRISLPIPLQEIPARAVPRAPSAALCTPSESMSPRKRGAETPTRMTYATQYADPMQHLRTSPRKAEKNLLGYGPERYVLEPGNAISPTAMIALPFGGMIEMANHYPDHGLKRRAGPRTGGRCGA